MTLAPTSSRGGGFNLYTTVSKSADQSVASNTTVAADNALQFTTVSGGAYIGEIFVVYGSPVGGSTPGIKFAFGEDGTDRGSVYALNKPVAGGDSVTVAVIASNLGNISARTATANLVFRLWFTLIGGGGTASLWWSQATGSTSATIVRSGSTLIYTRLN